ncbi:MAG TPA: Gmad2 immunoglobulin-like domain-containing protein [Flavobacterium sp.]
MKRIPLLMVLLLIVGCRRDNPEPIKISPEAAVADTTQIITSPPTFEPPKVHSNERFRNVTVQRTADNQFRITGEGQVFEASFGWVIEDGHNEIAKGFEMTDAGAPEWGRFEFTADAEKETEHSTLHLILFETSAKDGSRQYELPIVLE